MSKKVLVVDDEPHIREAIKFVLESEGFDVELAGDPNECYKKLEEENPDLVLLDIVMPTSGIDLLKNIKNSHPTTKVAMLTVVGSKFFRDQCEEMGAVDFITKPFKNEDLVQRVKCAIDQ
jgi:DNA-binding response OmpR family regulator